jgi:hypothetical protein
MIDHLIESIAKGEIKKSDRFKLVSDIEKINKTRKTELIIDVLSELAVEYPPMEGAELLFEDENGHIWKAKVINLENNRQVKVKLIKDEDSPQTQEDETIIYLADALVIEDLEHAIGLIKNLFSIMLERNRNTDYQQLKNILVGKLEDRKSPRLTSKDAA